MKFNDKVINMMLSENEKYKLRSRAQWSDSLQDYTIPQFIFSPKESTISFPNLNKQSRVEQSKEERQLDFKIKDVSVNMSQDDA